MMQSSHGTPPVPSPARLGLTNPTSSISSPSLPQNPNPSIPKSSSSTSTSVSQPQSNLTSTSSTSAALLSLLPPLPRAQSLLLQMSSLATKLFDVSPNRSHWSNAYRGALPSFILPAGSHPHPLSLDSRHPATPATTKDVLSLLHSLQTQLFESVTELQEILDLQDSKNKLSREIKAKDSALLSFAKKIKESELVLDRLVDDYADYRNRDLLHPNLDLTEVLAYAHKISYTTFAPPEHGAGLAPLRGALPPAPQDNEMRASQLYHFADMDVGVPKKAAVAGEGKEGMSAEVAGEVLMEPTPPREADALAFPGILPPMLPIAVPPGWKKGMPIELPTELPPMPPGWKPGDPLPLPPLDGVLVGNTKVEMPRVPQAQKETIEVKYVQLDIPDQDDDSSDYSSDVGSSEEEDDD